MKRNQREVPRAQLSLSRYFREPSHSSFQSRRARDLGRESVETDGVRESSLTSLHSVSSSGSEATAEAHCCSTHNESTQLAWHQNETSGYFDSSADRAPSITQLNWTDGGDHNQFQQMLRRAPCTLSSSLSNARASAVEETSPRKRSSDRTADDEGAMSVMRILQQPLGEGGFDGCLRYTDLTRLAAALRCSWSSDELDDLWYDIQDGHSSICAADVGRAAACIAQKIRSPPHFADCKECSAEYDSGAKKDGQNQSCGLDSPSALTPLDSSGSETRSRDGERRDSPRDPSARGRRREILQRICGPTVSSTRRNRKQPSPPSTAIVPTPKKPSSFPPASTPVLINEEAEVFNRLTKDIETRRARERSASRLAVETAARECTFTPRSRSNPADRVSSSRHTKGSACGPTSTVTPIPTTRNSDTKKRKGAAHEEPDAPNGKRPNSHSRATGVMYNKPTISSSAKLFPSVELSERERTEAWTSPASGGYMFRRNSANPSAALTQNSRDQAELRSEPTAPVIRRASPGPPTEVPPGYVEAVAKLRNYVASRRRTDYLSTLRPSQQRYFSSQARCCSSEAEMRRRGDHGPHSPRCFGGMEREVDPKLCCRGMTAEMETLLDAAASRTGGSEHVAALWRDFEHYGKPILRLPVENLPSPQQSNATGYEAGDTGGRPPKSDERHDAIWNPTSPSETAPATRRRPTSAEQKGRTRQSRPPGHVVDVRLARPQDLEILTRLSMSYDDPRRIVLDRLLKASLSLSQP